MNAITSNLMRVKDELDDIRSSLIFLPSYKLEGIELDDLDSIKEIISIIDLIQESRVNPQAMAAE